MLNFPNFSSSFAVTACIFAAFLFASSDGTSTKSPTSDGRRIRRRLQLIDFAVVGFPKTGTSHLLHSVLNTDETFMGHEEHCLSSLDPSHKLKIYKKDGKATHKDIKNGLKCPRDLEDVHGLDNYEKYYPETSFIVSLRHPVQWFESFYNYRVREHMTKKGDNWRPNVDDLIGPCNSSSPYVTHEYKMGEIHREGVCTDAAKFHHYLSRLGFTEMNSREELSLLQHQMSVKTLPRARLFLMELGQLRIDNQTRADLFVEDLQHYLGLKNELPSLSPHVKKDVPEEVRKQFIDICDDNFELLRSILVAIGKESSEWIRTYLLRSSQVFVSSKNHFLELIAKWGSDPCLEREK